MIGWKPVILALGLGLACAPAMADPAYRVTSIPLISGASAGEAAAVNNRGVVVGRCLVGADYYGFSYDASTGNLRNLGLLGSGDEHGVWGINDEGWMVATAQGEEGSPDRALLIAPSGVRIDITRQTVRAAPMGDAQARSINTLGAIAGISSFDCSLTQSSDFGSRWSPGGFFVTPLLGSNSECAPTAALSINDAGTLAGWAEMNVGSVLDPILVKRPFICDDEGQTALPTFNSTLEEGAALSISNQGDVCGYAEDSTLGVVFGALWLQGEITKLGPLPGETGGSIAMSVNAAADAVGRSGSEETGSAVLWIGGLEQPEALTALVEPGPRAAGYRLIAATGISDGGFIVGRGKGIDAADTSGQVVPFILLPCEPVVIQQPIAQTTCLLGSPAFSVRAVGAGPLQYQWRRNGVPLSDGVQPSGSVIAGATSRLMRIFGFGFGDEGVFDVAITGSCGTKLSIATNTHVCRADLSCDGIVTDSDFPIFVGAYEILDCADPAMPVGCPADLNSDGFVDDADFELFVQAYNALFCP